MVTNSKMRGEASTPMYKLESPATAVSRQFAPNLLDVKDSAIVTLQPEEFAQHLAYCALMVRPKGTISTVSLFSSVSVSQLSVWHPAC
jgi:hypothetical protein